MCSSDLFSSKIASRLAERDARKYQRKYDAEQLMLRAPDIYKLWSSYIDTNSVAADGSVAFHVVVKDVYTDAGRQILGFVGKLKVDNGSGK